MEPQLVEIRTVSEKQDSKSMVYLVCLSLSVVSAPRSLPARSIKDNFPTNREGFESEPLADFLMASWSIACDREDSSFAPVVPVLLVAFPFSMNSLIASTSETLYSCKPTMQTCCFPSSLMHSFLQNQEAVWMIEHNFRFLANPKPITFNNLLPIIEEIK